MNRVKPGRLELLEKGRFMLPSVLTRALRRHFGRLAHRKCASQPLPRVHGGPSGTPAPSGDRSRVRFEYRGWPRARPGSGSEKDPLGSLRCSVAVRAREPFASSWRSARPRALPPDDPVAQGDLKCGQERQGPFAFQLVLMTLFARAALNVEASPGGRDGPPQLEPVEGPRAGSPGARCVRRRRRCLQRGPRRFGRPGGRGLRCEVGDLFP